MEHGVKRRVTSFGSHQRQAAQARNIEMLGVKVNGSLSPGLSILIIKIAEAAILAPRERLKSSGSQPAKSLSEQCERGRNR